MDLTAEELTFLACLVENNNEEVHDSINIYKSFDKDAVAKVLEEQLLESIRLSSRLREESKKVRLEEGFPYAN
ncbi:hypothetical protein [Enterococcus phage SSsP-1]|uniref:Uncharacterized protein n=1 Tax=Enterococcus phage SSsP-1 TaxID=2859527 RepID=A0AAE8BFY5_9CAUD|nr:hypothetical protein [Enterococcus phage SSsP-1]